MTSDKDKEKDDDQDEEVEDTQTQVQYKTMCAPIACANHESICSAWSSLTNTAAK